MTLNQTRQILREMKKKNMSLQSDNTVRWLADRMSTIQSEMRQTDFLEKKTPIRRNALVKEGQMVMFGYNPATKQEMLFWDEFPIVVVIKTYRTGFLGLNLHYLPYPQRAGFLNSLRFYITDPEWIKNNNNNAEFFLTYKMAKNSNKLTDYVFCIKKYKFNNMLTRAVVIDPVEWLSVPFFPLDKFKGMGRKAVWNIIKSGYR